MKGPAVFKRRAVQMTFVKTPKDASPEETASTFDGPEQLAAYCEVAKDFLAFATISVGGAYTLSKVIVGVVDIAVNRSVRIK